LRIEILPGFTTITTFLETSACFAALQIALEIVGEVQM